ncbi:MAG TPA: DUF349 domain-containing protein [Cellvibrio sp.]|nr:DUF349 domain-containing protein [Cellvibrio sp.]
MKLLSRLFKKTPPKIATIEEQIQALAQQSDAQLISLATADGDDSLREAAIAKLNYGSELRALALAGNSVRIQNAARKRIGQLLDSKDLTLAQLAQDFPKQLELMSVVGYSTSASLELLEQISSPVLLLQLACEAGTTQIRQAAAARISEREHLEQLAKAAQTKDKNVYKSVRARLDVFKAQDAKMAELDAAAQLICGKLEKHAKLDADTLFKARLAVLQQEWNSLGDGLSASTAARYAAAANACEAKISARAEAIAQEEERQLLDQQALELARAAVANAKAFLGEIYAVADVEQLLEINYEHKLQELAQAIRLAANRNLALDSLNREFEFHKKQVLSLVEQIKGAGTVSQLRAQLQSAENTDLAQAAVHKLKPLLKSAQEFALESYPAVVTETRAALEQWLQERAALEQSAKNVLREFSDLTRKGLWSVEQGFVRKGRAIQKELNEKRQQIADLPKAVQAKFEEFEQQLGKLGDWHEFAVTPKKEALIVQMQQLIGNSMPPENLATKIHELQDSWKEVSKGGQQQDESLWQQFHQASEQAFAPCKEFFDAQAAAREQNLARRRDMLTQLESYLASYNWASADWPSVEKTLKVARQEWQQYWPVPRKAGNELQHAFEGLMEQLFAKITAEYENNKVAKQHLIESAQALVAAADTRASIDAVKKIQTQWKTIGKSWYKEDQQLWQDFRQHCDAIFARRNQEMEAVNNQRQASVQQAQTLLVRLEAVLALELPQLVAAKADIETIKNEFFALDLARDAAGKLNARLSNTLAAIAEKIDQERNKAEVQSWQDLFAVCNAIREFELAVIAAEAEPVLAEKKEALGAAIANMSRWPSGSSSLVQQRFAKAEAIGEQNQVANTELLRILTLRAEILAGRESPEQDKALRMNYQVQQMQQAFGSRDNSFEPLVLEWIALGGVKTDIYNSLLARFNACREAGVKK